MTPLVTAITRASLHDGPGIRTVVYLKGCPLSCRWCHNPENLSPQAEVLFYPQKCVGCGRCAALCPEHLARGEGERAVRPQGECAACRESARQCPAGALELCGESIKPDALFDQLQKDAAYFERSGGGVTFSGGECLLYPDYLVNVLAACKKVGISTAVESALCLPWENVEAVRPWVDTFLVDIKHIDDAVHRRYTGRGNRLILENIRGLAGIHDNIWIRVPLIPGVNDDRENLLQTAAFVRSLGTSVVGVELLPYNPLAEGKYQAAGRSYRSFGAPQSRDEVEKMERLFTAQGCNE